jgi:hypothetical protein
VLTSWKQGQIRTQTHTRETVRIQGKAAVYDGWAFPEAQEKLTLPTSDLELLPF